ncbi:MAG: Ig-like domain-containing protein [Candidatus Paceibacterota bacterium]|jgi:hypothetical protein
MKKYFVIVFSAVFIFLELYFLPTDALAQCSGSPDLATHASEQIDSRISQASSGTGLNLFSDFMSTLNMTGAQLVSLTDKPNSMQENIDSWAKKGIPLDFTGVATWNDWNGSSNPVYQGAATLITPRHFVTATHIKLPVGTKVTFIKPDASTTTRIVTGFENIPNSDVTVEVLDSDVDPSIKYYKVIDITTFWSLLSKNVLEGSSEVPIAVFNQGRQPFIHSLGVNLANPYNKNPYNSIPHYPSSIRASFSSYVGPGDSGQPGFLIVEDTPILLFVNTTNTEGSNVGSRITEINQAINSLGSGGYSATLYNSSCFTKYPITPTVTSILTDVGSISCLQNTPTCRMTIFGIGFTSQNNTVKVGILDIGNISSYNNGTAIDVNIPTDLSAGTYNVVISNSEGTSNPKIFMMLNNSSFPSITSVSPSSGPMGSTITLIGANFSISGTNNIKFAPTTGFKPEISLQSTNVTQNGTRLTATLPNEDYPVGTVFTIWIDNAEFGYSDENSSYERNPKTFTVALPPPVVEQDTTPPVRSNGLPSSTLSATTNSTNVSLSTNESAVCHWSSGPNNTFDQMSGRFNSSNNGTSHSVSVTLTPGNSYSYYIKCRDQAENTNTQDFPILFAVASLPAEENPPSDTTPPNISINSPLNNESFVEGTKTISVSTSDNVGVVGVQYYLDGTRLDSEKTTAPWTITKTFTPGTYSIYAIARDVAGNRKTSNTIIFNVTKKPVVIVQQQPIINPPIINPINTQPPVMPIQENDEVPFKAVATEINRNLALNDEGEDVLLLQKVLNKLGYEVATNGPGSIGKETTYFDNNTKEALAKYQSDHSEEGIVSTGILDNVTMAIINVEAEKLIKYTEDEATSTDQILDKRVEITSVATFFLYIFDTLRLWGSSIINLF